MPAHMVLWATECIILINQQKETVPQSLYLNSDHNQSNLERPSNSTIMTGRVWYEGEDEKLISTLLGLGNQSGARLELLWSALTGNDLPIMQDWQSCEVATLYHFPTRNIVGVSSTNYAHQLSF